MFPCRSHGAEAQAKGLMNGLKGLNHGKIWIDVEENPSPGCSWASHTKSSNCEYIVSLIHALKKEGANVGVYTSEYEWSLVVGSRGACH